MTKQITDICPECSPGQLIPALFNYAGEYCEESDEYLYSCDKCSAKVWIDAEEVRRA